MNGATKPAAAAVWSLDSADMLDDDLELINDDELLDDDDLKKPDPASLRGEFEKNIPTYNIYMKLLWCVLRIFQVMYAHLLDSGEKCTQDSGH